MSDAVAIKCAGVRKSYRLYQSPADMALDHFGLSRLILWRRGALPREHEALRGVDLTINRGERVGIIGRNGAGKTTLLKLIAGSVTRSFAATAGEIQVNGQVQALMNMGIGFHPEFSGLENVRAALVYNGLSQAQYKKALDDVVDFVQLGDFINRPMSTYSLGMQMRLQFAVATAIEPQILIIDEVLSAGDAYFAQRSAERIRNLAYSGCTLLLVSHSMDQIAHFCDRVIWLGEGRVVRDGSAADVISAYGSLTAQQYHAREQDIEGGTGEADQGPSLRPFNPPRPAHLYSEFVEQMTARAEGFAAGAGETVTLSSGISCKRRLQGNGPQITDVRVFARTARKGEFHVGDKLRIEIDVMLNGMPSAEARCAVEFYTVDGVRVARAVDTMPISHIGAGVVTKVVEFSELLLGAREFIGAVALIDSAKESDLSQAFDVLSRAIYLSITNVNDADPPYIHYPAQWHAGAERVALKSRVSATQ